MMMHRELMKIVLDEDSLEEVLLKLPLGSLTRFKTVSKQWRRVITSKSFKVRYMLHEPRFLCIYNDDKSNNLILKTMRCTWWSSSSWTRPVFEDTHHVIERLTKRDVVISSCCDGHVCIFDKIDLMKTPIVVTNPFIGKSKTLPLSTVQRQSLSKEIFVHRVLSFPGFGKDNVTGTYKLVWLHDKISSLSCEVFDFDVNQWREVSYDKYMVPYKISPHHVPVSVKGWVYWFIAKGEKKMILAYNLHTEMHQVINVGIVSEFDDIDMCSVNDCLWITSMKEPDGLQYFWRIHNSDSGRGVAKEKMFSTKEKMFSINSNMIWFNSLSPSQLIRIVATSKDNRNVLVTKLSSSKLIHLSPQTYFCGFNYVCNGPKACEFIPYVPSLNFPL